MTRIFGKSTLALFIFFVIASTVLILSGAAAQIYAPNTTTIDYSGVTTGTPDTGIIGTVTTTATVPGTTTTDTPTSQGTTVGATVLNYPLQGTTPAPMVLDANSAGKALIRGQVVTTGQNSIMVLSWGGLWTIRTNSLSKVFSINTNSFGDLSGIAVGDFIGAEGQIARDQILTLDATLVRDWTTTPFLDSEVSPGGGTTTPTSTPSGGATTTGGSGGATVNPDSPQGGATVGPQGGGTVNPDVNSGASTVPSGSTGGGAAY